jgi:hypothetical protein
VRSGARLKPSRYTDPDTDREPSRDTDLEADREPSRDTDPEADRELRATPIWKRID